MGGRLIWTLFKSFIKWLCTAGVQRYSIPANQSLSMKIFGSVQSACIKSGNLEYYGDDRAFSYGQVPSLCDKLSNLSEFMRGKKVALPGITKEFGVVISEERLIMRSYSKR